jgi:transcription elongation factor GreA
MSDRLPMTRAGYDKLEEELHRLKAVERPKIVKEIELARAHGDISENAEFHAAKERQSHLEGRVRLLEDKRRGGRDRPLGAIRRCGAFRARAVHLEDTETGDRVTYTILGEEESDVVNGCISVSSPVARALLGKAVGDSVTVRVPKGIRTFEVLEIRVG